MARRATREAATISGWATAVSRMVSPSDVVPWLRRSMPQACENTASCSGTPGSSSHGYRNPGDWEPWPGQMIASTCQPCPNGCGGAGLRRPPTSRTVLVGYLQEVSYTHLRAHETDSYLVCRLLLEKKKKK